MDDRQLIEGCIRGDARCEKMLYNRFSQKMYTVCRRYARHDAEAQDILQEALVKVYKKIGSYRFEGKLEAWIKKIVVNTALKLVRKQSFQNEKIGIEDYHDVVVNPKVFAHLSAEELLSLIAKLPDGYRHVFNLNVIEEYSHKEVAEMLNIKESTSRSQLVKARRMLQTFVLKHEKVAL